MNVDGHVGTNVGKNGETNDERRIEP